MKSVTSCARGVTALGLILFAVGCDVTPSGPAPELNGGSAGVPFIDANDDLGVVTPSGGVAVANVLTNDRIGRNAVVAGSVTLTQVSSTSAAVTLMGGAVLVAPGTAQGTYTLVYRMCDGGYCDTATVTVHVTTIQIVVSEQYPTATEQKSMKITIRLSHRPTQNVQVLASYFAGTAVVATATPPQMVFTPDTWNIPMEMKLRQEHDPNKYTEAATFKLTAAGLPTVPVVVVFVDDDAGKQLPKATINDPINGQTVSGRVNFQGTVVDTNDITMTEFFVDGRRVYTDTRAGNEFWIGHGWDSTTVPNGWHVLEMKGWDDTGKDGRMLIKVFVDN